MTPLSDELRSFKLQRILASPRANQPNHSYLVSRQTYSPTQGRRGNLTEHTGIRAVAGHCQEVRKSPPVGELRAKERWFQCQKLQNRSVY